MQVERKIAKALDGCRVLGTMNAAVNGMRGAMHLLGKRPGTTSAAQEFA
jgi:hypothetical protein